MLRRVVKETRQKGGFPPASSSRLSQINYPGRRRVMAGFTRSSSMAIVSRSTSRTMR